MCGNSIKKWKDKNKKVKKCSDFAEKIKIKHEIDVTADEQDRHPSQICHLCYSNLFLPKPHNPLNKWPPHPERGICSVCAKEEEIRAGRPGAKYARLEQLDRGEQSAKQAVAELFKALAKKTTIFFGENFTTEETSIQCPTCCQIFNRPVEMQCHHVFCLDCLQMYYSKAPSSSLLCPSCHKYISLKDTNPVWEYFINILENAKVTCKTCKQSSWLKCTSEHDCNDPKTSQHIDEQIFRDIMNRKMSASGKIGQQVTSTLLKQNMEGDGGTVVRLSTGGKVSL